MSRNGSGVYSLNTAGQPVVSGTTITSSAFNAATADIATALTQSICVDGQSVITGNIPFAGFKATGIGVATTLGDALSYGRDATVTTLAATTTITAPTITTTGIIAAANTRLLAGASATMSAGATNYTLGTTAALSGYLSFAEWNSGEAFALIFIAASGIVYTIASSNAAGTNSCFDTTNSFASNGANGIAIFSSIGSIILQTKTNYNGPTAFRLAQFG